MKAFALTALALIAAGSVATAQSKNFPSCSPVGADGKPLPDVSNSWQPCTMTRALHVDCMSYSPLDPDWSKRGSLWCFTPPSQRDPDPQAVENRGEPAQSGGGSGGGAGS